MPAALLAHDLVRVHGDRVVLDGVSLTAAPGRRIGLIGENGAGKSTLLRLLAGTEEPDAGSVERPADLGLGAQELPWPGSATIADVLADAVADARAAVAAVDELAAQLPERGAEYAERLEWCQYHDAWDGDRRAARTLDGLGLAGVAHDRTLGSLSGGQRSRVGLAALLVRRPDALLLDEPTNHLDDDAAAFLEETLRSLPGVVVLASHDRAFVDAVCTDVIDLDPAVDGPTRHGGGYTAYLAERRAARDRWAEQYAAEQDELEELRTSVAVTAREVAPGRPRGNEPKMFYGFKRGRVQSQVSRRVRNARRRLDELDRTRRAARPSRCGSTARSAPRQPARRWRCAGSGSPGGWSWPRWTSAPPTACS